MDHPAFRCNLPRRTWLRALALAPAAGLPLAGCALAPASGLPPAPAPAQQPPAPRVRVGDRWRYAETNAFSGERIAEVAHEVVEAGERIRIRLTDSRGRPRFDEVYARPWAVLTEATFDYPQTYEQPMPLVPEPIAAGAGSRLRTHYRVSDSSLRYDWQQWIDAPAWERVRVPAGEFDALRVERRIWFTHTDHNRFDSVRRDVLWYAPAVERWVRREWTGWYRWPDTRFAPPMREAWVVQELIERIASPRMGGDG